MIKINIEEHKLQKLEKQYKEALIKWLDKRRIKKDADYRAEWDYYFNNRESLITCKPEDMQKQWKQFLKRKIGRDYQTWKKSSLKEETSFGKFIQKMNSLYNEFMKSEYDESNDKKDDDKKSVGYWFFDSLGLNVCPYCNRNYILTIEVDKKNTTKYRPEIDHFYPKSKYPIFALSFYNFIPACPTCNHIKRELRLKISPWKGYIGKYKEPVFRVKNTVEDLFLEAPKIEIINGVRKDISILGIDRLYNKHTDVVQDILNRIQAYNTDAYSAVLESFQGIVNTEGELDRMVWGNYTDPDEFSKRPFSKLTSDILKQYKIK